MKNITVKWEPRGDFGIEGLQLGDKGIAFKLDNSALYKVVMGTSESIGIDFVCTGKALKKIFQEVAK